MSKSQFYLSQCAEAASKSPMCFCLGAVLVKGGKVIASGYNHHRTHYDGGEISRRGKGPGHRKPVSMHAEMHAIFSATDGWSPAFKQQVWAKNKGSKKEKEAKDVTASSSSQASRSTTGQSHSHSPPGSSSSTTTTTSTVAFGHPSKTPQCLSAGPRPQCLQEQELQVQTPNQEEQSTPYGQQQLQLVYGGCGPRVGYFSQRTYQHQQPRQQQHPSSSPVPFAFSPLSFSPSTACVC